MRSDHARSMTHRQQRTARLQHPKQPIYGGDRTTRSPCLPGLSSWSPGWPWTRPQWIGRRPPSLHYDVVLGRREGQVGLARARITSPVPATFFQLSIPASGPHAAQLLSPSHYSFTLFIVFYYPFVQLSSPGALDCPVIASSSPSKLPEDGSIGFTTLTLSPDPDRINPFYFTAH